MKSVFDEILCLIALTLILSPLTAISMPVFEVRPNFLRIELLGYFNSDKCTIIFLKNNSPMEYYVSKLIVNNREYSLSEILCLKPYEATEIFLPANLSQLYHLTLVCVSGENFRVI
ncbi:MAG: hypothetical protein N3F64_00600 [Nitrososphaeria archaeon]|nr:hypothetical protein [Nitrososphaeria archaeon]